VKIEQKVRKRNSPCKKLQNKLAKEIYGSRNIAVCAKNISTMVEK